MDYGLNCFVSSCEDLQISTRFFGGSTCVCILKACARDSRLYPISFFLLSAVMVVEMEKGVKMVGRRGWWVRREGGGRERGGG